jgi:putative addiction module antidote
VVKGQSYNDHGYGGDMKLKLRAVGTSTGVLLPKEMLIRLKVKKGDTLFAVETPAGYLLTPYDPEVEKQLGLGRGFMGKYRSVFRALAK